MLTPFEEIRVKAYWELVEKFEKDYDRTEATQLALENMAEISRTTKDKVEKDIKKLLNKLRRKVRENQNEI